MPFKHTHADGSFWFTSAMPLSGLDREEVDTQSSGFSSKEVTSIDAKDAIKNLKRERAEKMKPEKDESEKDDAVPAEAEKTNDADSEQKFKKGKNK